MKLQSSDQDTLLRAFPKLLQLAIHSAAIELRDQLPPRLQSEGAYIRAIVVSRWGWLIGLVLFGLPLEAGRISHIHGATYAATWISALNVSTVVILFATGCTWIAYSLEFQRSRSQTLVWHRASLLLIELARAQHPYSSASIRYATDATLRLRKQRRTYGLAAVSALVTALTLCLGKDWLEKGVNRIGADHGDLVIISAMLVFLGGYSMFHFPVWTLEGIRDALEYNLQAP